MTDKPRFPAVPYQLLAIGVFPAHAGMTRAALTDAESVWCVPRPRGDDPQPCALGLGDRQCSPSKGPTIMHLAPPARFQKKFTCRRKLGTRVLVSSSISPGAPHPCEPRARLSSVESDLQGDPCMAWQP